MGTWSPLVAIGLFLALWIVATTIAAVMHRLRNAPQRGLGARLAANPAAWYGMLLAHLGVAVFIVGVTLVKGYGIEENVPLDVGQSVTVGGEEYTFRGVAPVTGPNYRGLAGTIEVRRDGKLVQTLHPEKRVYNASGSTMTEAAIDAGFLGDRYVSLGEPVTDKGEAGAWGVRVYVKPFVDWIWAGAFLMALGGFVAMSDRRVSARSPPEIRRAGRCGAAGLRNELSHEVAALSPSAGIVRRPCRIFMGRALARSA